MTKIKTGRLRSSFAMKRAEVGSSATTQLSESLPQAPQESIASVVGWKESDVVEVEVAVSYVRDDEPALRYVITKATPRKLQLPCQCCLVDHRW
jgi:hypothetical protein